MCAHLELLLEELVVGLAVAATQAVPERGVLSVVVVEVKMVDSVASGAVDDGRVVCVLAVVDHDGPDVDEDEESHGGELGQREQEWEDVIWQTLGVSVKRVESVRGERRGHDPLVVGLVDVLVDARVVQAAVDPVDAEVGKDEEEGVLSVLVPRTRALFYRVVKLGVATHFGEKPGHR